MRFIFTLDHHARSLEIRVDKDDHAFELLVTEDHGQTRVERFHLIRDLIDRQKAIIEQWNADGFQFDSRSSN